ncbi:MAG: HEPN domain-containing protein [Cyanobacteria bacterium P01_A01_bin.114]
MSDLGQAKALLQAALRDLKALRGMTDAQIFADEIFGFHGQQAAEKALKAWIAALGERYLFTELPYKTAKKSRAVFNLCHPWKCTSATGETHGR